MTERAFETYKTQLEELSTSIGQTVASLRSEVQFPVGPEAQLVSQSPPDLDDLGTDEYAQTATLLQTEVKLQHQISEAFIRLQDGTFGICTRCGNPIPDERLEALPFVEYCVACSDAVASSLTTSRSLRRKRRHRPR